MHLTVKNLLKIKSNVKIKLSEINKSSEFPKIIAVSKTFKIDHIEPLINHGHLDYGENNKNIKLHLIGGLQSNKVKIAVKLFDYIHSLDSEKLANKIAKQEIELKRKVKLFIQVNIGNELQKSGISEKDLVDFFEYCKDLKLNILGLMCIPPFDEDSTKYFIKMRELNKKIGLSELSMGMSSDYLKAIEHGSSYVRIGSDIFGNRD